MSFLDFLSDLNKAGAAEPSVAVPDDHRPRQPAARFDPRTAAVPMLPTVTEDGSHSLAGPLHLVGQVVPELRSVVPVPVRRRHLSDVQFEIASRDTMGDAAGPADADTEVLRTTIAMGTDLIKGVYEGGLKTWECSVDLAAYVLNSGIVQPSTRILELGCGSALPSMALLAHRVPFAHLTLSDYNVQVLHLVTAPGVVLNAGPPPADDELDRDGAYEAEIAAGWDAIPENVDFVSGDWSLMAEHLSQDRYDLVLTSETIYDLVTAPRLLDLIEAKLAHTGRALVAAKAVYFGVGGGTFEFNALVSSRGKMRCSTVHVETSGGVRREILELTWLN
ncbi:hypothetical protein H9P43_010099 [Blastocladiella emersonii ATCC 22665]|nr:hypothetical protein H9P43_010099 [Blastocladiella emersonii ATCC 22665]